MGVVNDTSSFGDA